MKYKWKYNLEPFLIQLVNIRKRNVKLVEDRVIWKIRGPNNYEKEVEV